jgi:hypothetical protein
MTQFFAAIVFILILCAVCGVAQDKPKEPKPLMIPASGQLSPVLQSIRAGFSQEYTVRLLNGDILTGLIIEVMSKPDDGIKLETGIGTLTIFAQEIAEITVRTKTYRHNHRLYIMPTAEAIGTNHFVGLWELLFAYAGIGITDYVSITAGRSLAPVVLPEEQVSLINLKITPYSGVIDDSGNRITAAIGGNLTLLNAANPLWHAYAGATFHSTRTSITGLLFYKTNDPTLYRVTARNFLDFAFAYAPGTFGFGAGLDSRIGDRQDVHFIGELWNGNIVQPSSTAILLGLRIGNTALSADFGLAIFTQPFAFPFVSFVWTPF